LGEKEIEQVYFIATGLSPLLHVKDLICSKKDDLLLGFQLKLASWAGTKNPGKYTEVSTKTQRELHGHKGQ